VKFFIFSCLSEANRAKLAIAVPTTLTVSHSNGPEWAQHNQTGFKRINKQPGFNLDGHKQIFLPAPLVSFNP